MNRVPLTCVAVLSLLFALSATNHAAEKAKAAGTDTPVFHTGTRVVLVDVVATDSNGKPVHGLKKQDFQVFDDGKAQNLRSFDEHVVEPVQAPAEKPPVLGPGVYSNWAPSASNGAVNIVLFDTLNMDWQDQAFARKKMVEYLKTLPAGQQVALFTLGSHLKIVQSFTESTDALIAAAKKLGSISNFQEPGGESQSAIVEQLGNALPPQVDSTGGTQGEQSAAMAALQAPPPGVHDPSSILEGFLAEDVRETDDFRMRITLEALRELARTMGSIPGRKNLIWVSGEFPAMIGSYTELSGLHVYNREIRATAALLAAHQIAVYPIDARGLITPAAGGAGADSSGRSIIATSGCSQNAYSNSLQNFSRGLQSSHDAMDEIAQQTGGRAFYNSNDVSGAISKSIESGASYYTLAYTPTNKEWNGQLRKIEVKLAQKNIKLMYRRGYYAVADPFAPVLKIKTTDIDVQKRLIEAVQPNSPQASAIMVEAKAVASGSDKPIEIDYVINARDLTLPTSENGDRAVRYQLVAVAWDDKDANAGQAWEMVDKEIPLKDATKILNTGIHSHRFLTLKPGTYHLYIGVIDVESKKIGTLVIPLRVPKEVAALK